MSKKYLVTINESGISGTEVLHKSFSDYAAAKEEYDAQVEWFINRVVEDNDLSDAEAEEYRNEIDEDYYSVNDYLASAIDPDNEWSVYLELIEDADPATPNRTEILLTNAIDVLREFLSWEEIKTELGLTDDEYKTYILDAYDNDEEDD